VRTSAFIATSLDGFIAREDGAIDWLPQPGEEGGEDYGYEEFYATVDALVMGRRTFDAVIGLGEWPYGSKPVVVLSHRPVPIPEAISWTVESMSCTPAELMRRLGRRGLKHLYVDGGRTIQEFLREGLLDQLIITTVPILLGRGLSLFGGLDREVRLHHAGTRSYPDGLVQSRYEVLQDAPAETPVARRGSAAGADEPNKS
jgi:dihydrofolate reductase